MNLEQLTTLLGWSLVINTALLLVAWAAVTLLREFVLSIHTRMLGLSEEALMPIYINYIAQYKIFVIVFNVSPYIALKIMGY